MNKSKVINIADIKIGGNNPLVLIAGPCVIESRDSCLELADKLSQMAKEEKINFIFKASYDKANRMSINSFRGLGIKKGLDILSEVKQKYHLPILTDIHNVEEIASAAQVADILQLPAFLCRQTDLTVSLGESNKVINIKKGQFLAPWDIKNIIEKIEYTGNKKIIVTERGVSFGYNNLVADMRSLVIMRQFGYPIIFDATHSVQKPGGQGQSSGGDSEFVPALARAATAVGCDGVFIETHVNPMQALSDKYNALQLDLLLKLWRQLISFDKIIRD